MSKSADAETEQGEDASGWLLPRDVLVFQFKLLLDGLRDVLLSPASIVAVLAGYLVSPENPRRYFDRLMGLGLKSDHFINLFSAKPGQHVGAAGVEEDEVHVSKHSTDRYVEQLEQLLLAEYERGGLVTDMKDGTEQLIRRLRRRKEPGRK